MRIVVAVGGNAILRRGDRGTLDEQMLHAHEILGSVAELAAAGHRLVVTHGNGPIVGNIVVRNEAARDRIPPMPLYIDGADSQGGIGFMLGSVLASELRSAGASSPVATLVTQVVVDPGDQAFHRPTKPIGPPFSEAEAEELARTDGWFFCEDDGVFRRVVPSPHPLRIVEADTVATLSAGGTVVIACGGGGIPVIEDENGDLTGVDAVIDKDLTSALLARHIQADMLVILMEHQAVYLDWGTEHSRPLGRVTADELAAHLDAGQFEEGSVEPKVRAAIDFAATGHPAVICRAPDLLRAVTGDAGTFVTQ